MLNQRVSTMWTPHSDHIAQPVVTLFIWIVKYTKFVLQTNKKK